MKIITKNTLEYAYKIKTFLNGTEVAKMFNLGPGPRIRHVLDKIMNWQLQNRSKNREELLQAI